MWMSRESKRRRRHTFGSLKKERRRTRIGDTFLVDKGKPKGDQPEAMVLDCKHFALPAWASPPLAGFEVYTVL